MGAHPLLSLVALARGRAALAAERPAEAYVELMRIFTPTDTAYQPFVRGWALADLTEAPLHGDGTATPNLVRDILREWQKIADDTQAPHLKVQLAYANALLAHASDRRASVPRGDQLRRRRLAVLRRPRAARLRRVAAQTAPRRRRARAAP